MGVNWGIGALSIRSKAEEEYQLTSLARGAVAGSLIGCEWG
jgi:hypothetical protein